MRSLKKFKNLEKARKKKQEISEKYLKNIRAKKNNPRRTRLLKSKLKPKPIVRTEQDQEITTPVKNKILPWGKLHSGDADLKLFTRSQNKQEVQLQPWARELVNLILEVAGKSEIYLCLIWPVRFDGLALLHSLVNIERNFAKDLRGMRTFLYPGNRSCRIPLQAILANREQLSDLFRSLWVQNENNELKFECHTQSKSFQAMLTALNDIRNYQPEVDDPSLAELVPAFTYLPEQNDWVTVAKFPLERSLKKVDRLARRRILREEVNQEWGNPINAPGALMVLHQTATKSDWKASLQSKALKENCEPEIFLLDATSLANQRSHMSVMKIPDFLNVAIENGYENTSSVIVTDDPKTFFVLRDRMKNLKLGYKEKIWAAESELGNAILSTQALPEKWKPVQKSNANFKVEIVDREASQVALSFQKLAKEAGAHESPSYQAVMDACIFIQRLSSLPAGYSDLTAMLEETKEEQYTIQKFAWSSIYLKVKGVLESGVLNEKREDANRTISKAEKLIDKWVDTTPLAEKLLSEVEKYVTKGRGKLSVVLPNSKYIKLAQNFLHRKRGGSWETDKHRINWHTLFTVSRLLTENHKSGRFLFVGVNPDVIRCLVAHPDIPHGTSILITYKQAKSTLTTLTSMMSLEALKPYRGRIGLLIQQLTLRLNNIPNLQNIDKLQVIDMHLNLESEKKLTEKVNSSYYKFELEDDSNHYATGMLYNYKADQDPFFHRVHANSIDIGDFIFVMSNELRTKLESVLHLTNNGLDSEVYPQRVLLKLYHDDVKSRCDLFFQEKNRRRLAREIHKEMTKIDSSAKECSLGRVYYWLELQADGDTRPHAPKDPKFFKIFCRALKISDDDALSHWNAIRSARSLNIELGRQLFSRYAEILFQPESAFIYRNVPKDVIQQLQHEALRYVYCVKNIVPPRDERNEVK